MTAQPSLVEVASKAVAGIHCKGLALFHCQPPENCSCRQAGAAVARAFFDALAEPTEAQLTAARELPVTKQVNSMIETTAFRYGGSNLPEPPNSPIQQWYRAMIAALKTEVESD